MEFCLVSDLKAMLVSSWNVKLKAENRILFGNVGIPCSHHVFTINGTSMVSMDILQV